MSNPRPLERRVGRVDGATTPGPRALALRTLTSGAIRGVPLLRPTDLRGFRYALPIQRFTHLTGSEWQYPDPDRRRQTAADLESRPKWHEGN